MNHNPDNVPSWAGIVKIQIALFPPGQPCLLYNEDRSIETTVPQEEVIELFEPGDLKIYHHASWDNQTGLLTLGAPAPAQEW
jgi:hypothetical protein